MLGIIRKILPLLVFGFMVPATLIFKPHTASAHDSGTPHSHEYSDRDIERAEDDEKRKRQREINRMIKDRQKEQARKSYASPPTNTKDNSAKTYTYQKPRTTAKTPRRIWND